MSKKISVLMPYKPDHGQRDRLFDFVKNFYNVQFPGAELCIGESRSELFSRSQAINAAAKQASRDIFVIADTDIIFNPEIITESIKLLDRYAWVIPHDTVLNLTEVSTQNILDKGYRWLTNGEGHPRRGPSVGGLNVVPRKNFEMVNGFDERFVGWGRDDDAFALAMNTICGRYYRIPTSIYHLWHHKVGESGNPNIANNTRLLGRYKKVRHDRKGMIHLVNEKGHRE